jgi:hypothetical protein
MKKNKTNLRLPNHCILVSIRDKYLKYKYHIRYVKVFFRFCTTELDIPIDLRSQRFWVTSQQDWELIVRFTDAVTVVYVSCGLEVEYKNFFWCTKLDPNAVTG